MEMETSEARLAKQRVRNSTGALRTQSPATAEVGMSGAVVYALLDVANAIRSTIGDDEKTRRLLHITDSIAEAISEGADADKLKALADSYLVERGDFGIDQSFGVPPLDGMR